MMLHSEAGRLNSEIEAMNKAMSFYYQITDGHGMGAEQLDMKNIMAMADKTMTLVVKYNDVSYNFAANAIDIASLVDELGANTQNSLINVNISKLSQSILPQLINATKKENIEIINTQIEITDYNKVSALTRQQ